MQYLIYWLGLALVVQSKFASAIVCSMDAEFNTACKFGNMSLTTFKGITVRREHCDEIVNISHLAAPPVISITWPNRSELFTVLMLDAGQYGNGPLYLQWLVTNVTADQLSRLIIPSNRVPAPYEAPSLPPTQRSAQYYQVIAFRQNSTLKNIMPPVHSTHRRTFNLRKWLTGALDYVRLCGPVAGLQIRSKFDNTTRPVPPPVGFVYPGQVNYPSAPYPVYPSPPVQPGYPNIPVQPSYNTGIQQNPNIPPPPGWIHSGPPASGNQGQTSWASSGTYVSDGQKPKKSFGLALRPEGFIIVTVFIISLLGYVTN